MCECMPVCLLQAVEDGTLEETEAKKQRRRKRKPNPSEAAEDTTGKVCADVVYLSMPSMEGWTYNSTPLMWAEWDQGVHAHYCTWCSSCPVVDQSVRYFHVQISGVLLYS